jgi:hypothetical protein
MEQKYKSTVDGLLELLTRIKETCGGDTPIQVNVLGNGCVTGLTSVWLDNDMGNSESIVYIETDIEENYYPDMFEFYAQGEEI